MGRLPHGKSVHRRTRAHSPATKDFGGIIGELCSGCKKVYVSEVEESEGWGSLSPFFEELGALIKGTSAMEGMRKVFCMKCALKRMGYSAKGQSPPG